MPRQSLTAMKVALGLRAQYATIIGVSFLMLTQVFGAIIFSGNAKATGTVTYDRSITSKVAVEIGHMYPDANLTLAKDSAGNIYVGDSLNHVIKKYTASGVYLTEWGSVGNSVGQFDSDGSPRRLAVDANDNVYAIDGGSHNRILKFTSSGEYLGQIGSSGSGDGQFDFGSMSRGIGGLDFDSSGNIYVTDTGNDRIQKLTASGDYIKQWQDHNFDTPESDVGGSIDNIAVNPQGDVYVTVDQRAVPSTWSTPYTPLPSVIEHFNSNGDYQGYFEVEATAKYQTGGLDIDSSGNIYVASGPNVDKYTPLGVLDARWTNVSSSHADKPPASSVVLDSSNNIYTLDGEDVGYYAQPYVKKINSSGTILATFSNGADGVLGEASNITKGLDGAIYVVAYGDPSGDGSTGPRIQKFDSSGKFVRSWHGDLVPDCCSPGSSRYESIGQIAVGPNGNIYALTASGFGGITEFTPEGVKVRKWDLSLGGSNDGQFSSYGVGGIAISPAGEIYLTDPGNHRVQVFNSVGVFQRTWGHRGYNAYDNSFEAPKSIAISPSGDVYVADSDAARIKKLDLNGNYLSGFYGGTNVGSINVDQYGRVFVVQKDTKSIVMYASDNTFIASWGSAGTGNGQFSTANHGFNGGVVVGDDNKIYALDDGGARIQVFQDNSFDLRVFTKPAASISSNGATFRAVTSDLLSQRSATYTFEYGQGNLYSPATTPTVAPAIGLLDTLGGSYGSGSTQLAGNAGVATYGSNVVYVADSSNDRVKRYYENGTSTTVENIGSSGSDLGQFSNPQGVAVGPSGALYVADTFNHRIQEFATYNGAATAFESGHVSTPQAIAVDPVSGDVYVTDRDSHGVYRFDRDGNFITSWDTYTGVSYIYPVALTVDYRGRVYVASDPGGPSEHHVYAFSSDGTPITEIGSQGFDSGQYYHAGPLTVDRSNNLYIYDYSHGVQAYDADGNYVTSWGVVEPSDTGDRSVQGIAIDSSNTMYVSDSGSSIIKHYAAIISLPVTGLACNTNYAYKGIATVGSETAYGNEKQFTTSACAGGQFGITTTTLPDGAVGQGYSQAIQTENCSGSVSYSFSGNDVPPGLTVDIIEAGAVAGTPSVAGTYTFIVVANCDSGGSDTQEYTITIGDSDHGSSIAITTTSLPDGDAGRSYNATIESENVHGTATYSIVSGGLPHGLSLAHDGTISGTPDADTSAYSLFTVQVTDDQGSDTQDLTLAINYYNPILICDGTANIKISMNVNYGHTICVDNIIGYPTFSVISGSLPPGLELDQMTGEIHGTPTELGSYSALIEVRDLMGVDSHQYDFIVDAAPLNTPIVTITSPSNGTFFDNKHDTVEVTGTGPANQTITTYMDGYQLGTTITNASGNWSYLVNNVFPGSHSFDAKWIPSGDVAFVSNIDNESLRSTVNLVDVASGDIAKTIYMPTETIAVAATFNHSGTKVYISGFDLAYTPMIWEFNPISGMIERSLEVPAATHPFLGTLSVTSDDKYAYVLNSYSNGRDGDGAVFYKVDLESMAVASAGIDLSPQLGYCTAYATPTCSDFAVVDDMLYWPLRGPDHIVPVASVLNLTSLSLSTIDLGFQEGVLGFDVLVEAGVHKVYFAYDNQLIIVDAMTNTIAAHYAIADVANYIESFNSFTIDEAHHRAYLMSSDRLYVVNLANGQVDWVQHQNPDQPYGSSISTDGSQLYLVGADGLVVVYDTTQQDFHQIVSASGLSFAAGNFIGRIVPPTATVAFSVGTAPVTPTPNPKPITPVITDVTPPLGSTPAPRPVKSSPITATQTVPAAQNNLFALAKRIPEPFAIGFPWLLLLLALTLVSIQYYQVRAEEVSTKLMQKNIARQKQLVEEQNNFVALSTHYLHTPLTIMEGEISLMVKAGTISQEQATKLQATLTSLNAEAEAVLAQEEQDRVE